jgi:8-oxo-dGTP pyrophosphatase MutT (NUDIX family)
VIDGPVTVHHGPGLRRRVARNLAGRAPRTVTAPERHAAVALTLVPSLDGRAEVLAILRAARGRHHVSQYALPGGRLDPGETPEQAARRELAEELDVHLPGGAVLGRLDDRRTASGFTITPVVLWADGPVTTTPAPAEVAEVFRLPLDELLRDAGEVDPTLPHGFPAMGTVIFAPTGAILLDFVEVAVHGRPPPEVHPWEPPFVRR